MGQDPDAIRDEVAQTRERMGETIDALGYKTDVKRRARRAAGIAQENPLGLALAAVAVGFVGGLLVPTSRVEDEKIGPMAEQMREQVKQTGQEALDRGKQVAQSAAETARDEAQRQGKELAESAKENASSVSG